MSIDRTGISEIIIVPNIIQYLLPGEGDSLILYKISQELKLLKAQLHRFSVDLHDMRRLVDRNAARADHVASVCSQRSAQDRVHPRHKDLRAEGLGNILVYSKFESLKLIPLFRTGGEHDDRDL